MDKKQLAGVLGAVIFSASAMTACRPYAAVYGPLEDYDSNGSDSGYESSTEYVSPEPSAENDSAEVPEYHPEDEITDVVYGPPPEPSVSDDSEETSEYHPEDEVMPAVYGPAPEQ